MMINLVKMSLQFTVKSRTEKVS